MQLWVQEHNLSWLQKKSVCDKALKNCGVYIVYIAITWAIQKSSQKQRINLIFVLNKYKSKAK